jgi:hypothetical protein
VISIKTINKFSGFQKILDCIMGKSKIIDAFFKKKDAMFKKKKKKKIILFPPLLESIPGSATVSWRLTA